MTPAPTSELLDALHRLDLVPRGADVVVTPLPGGVSSDIARVDVAGRSFCVKQALPKLKVAADWRAPVARNHSEAEWIRVAGEIVPDAVPRLIGEDRTAGLFAMSWLAPETHPVWKAELRDGRIDPAVAAEVGRRISLVHAATAGRVDIAARFANDDIFQPIRLEPYLLATAERHPDCAGALRRLAETTAHTKLALVHGDVSPKNILVGPHGPVFLDAECAWYGDPAFDLAFCLNHLLLKCAWRPESRARLPRGVSRARERLSRRRFVGAARRARGAHGTAAAGASPRARRRQVAGRVPHRGGRSRTHPRVRETAPPCPADATRRGGRGMAPVDGTPVSGTAIASVRGRRVWDSRGRPTVEAEVGLAGGARGRAIAPAGASRGTHEAIDLRDGGARLGGMDVAGAVANVNGAIARALAGMDARDQAAVDAALGALDGTPDRSRLGGNATTAVSLAVLHAAAAGAGVPVYRQLMGPGPIRLPLPEIQIFGGGAHAGRRVDVQDFMVMPLGAASFAQALEMTAEVYRAAGELMRDAGKLAGVADEGGWWPAFDANDEALDWLVRAIERAGFTPGDEVAISLDIAATRGPEFRSGGTGATGSASKGASSTRMRWARCSSAGSRATRSSRSRTRSPRTTATGSHDSPGRWAIACRSSATTSW